MTVVAIDGVGKVELGDEFNKLSPEQQDATIQGIVRTVKSPLKDAGKPEVGGWRSYVPSEISDIPSEISNAFGESLDAVKGAFNNNIAEKGAIGSTLATGKAILGVPGMAFSPIVGTARSVGGHLLTRAIHGAGTLINPEVAAKDNQQEIYDKVKGEVDQALAAAGPAKGGLRTGPAYALPNPAPSPVQIPTGPLDVILSEGQTTRNLPAIQKEQAALRGTSGPSAQSRAQEFADQQRQQVAAARDKVVAGLDPIGGQQIVDGPQQAAELAQQSIQSIAGQRKAGVTQSYDYAKSLPGEIHADVFRDIGNTIKTDLSARPEPIIIDELTPRASKAIDFIESRIAELRIKNKADPNAPADPASIVGVNLNGIDQWRRHLSTMKRDAYSSGNAADGRAMNGVISSFDDQVSSAVNSGAFRGDPRAVRAWNDARAAHADYKSTFSAGKGDPVGRVVERILGKANNPAAIPNDVADFIYGSSGVNPGSLNVAVSNRVRKILGDQSPEWAGVKQGLFSRLVETPEGVADLGPGKIAQRLNQFLNGNGKELANSMFSPIERALIKQYADLHRALEVPQAGANWSNTATFLAPLIKSASARTGSLIGGLIGHIPIIGKIAGPLMDHAGGIVTNAANARQIVKQMPLVTEAAQKFQRAVAAYNRSNSPPSKVALGVAASNMARAFKNIGIELSLESPSVGRANDQPEAPRPPGQ